MKLSEKKQSEVYAAISHPIMDLRIKYTKAKPLSAEQLDRALYDLQIEIWKRLHKALKIQGLK